MKFIAYLSFAMSAACLFFLVWLNNITYDSYADLRHRIDSVAAIKSIDYGKNNFHKIEFDTVNQIHYTRGDTLIRHTIFSYNKFKKRKYHDLHKEEPVFFYIVPQMPDYMPRFNWDSLALVHGLKWDSVTMSYQPIIKPDSL